MPSQVNPSWKFQIKNNRPQYEAAGNAEQSFLQGSQTSIALNQYLLASQSLKDTSHPVSFWQQLPNQKLLRTVFNEDANSSEDEYGNPKYVKEKDPNYLELQRMVEDKRLRF